MLRVDVRCHVRQVSNGDTMRRQQSIHGRIVFRTIVPFYALLQAIPRTTTAHFNLHKQVQHVGI